MAEKTKKKKAKKPPSKKRRSTAGRRARLPKSKLTVGMRDYLDAIVKVGGNIVRASELSGINKWSHYNWKKKHDYYREEYETALAEAKDVREHTCKAALQEAWEKGWDEEIIEQEMVAVDKRNPQTGEKTGETELIVTKQKRRRTKKLYINALFYELNGLCGNPARLEVTGKDGGPVDHRVSVEAFRELAGL